MEPGVQKIVQAYAVRTAIFVPLMIATIVMMVLVADGHHDLVLWAAGVTLCFGTFSMYMGLWVLRSYRPALTRLREERDERIRRQGP